MEMIVHLLEGNISMVSTLEGGYALTMGGICQRREIIIK
jgi:hypothetical protein